MSCEFRDIFAVAEMLYSADPETEANLRSSASRAYYSALHAVDNTVPDQKAFSAGDAESSHQKIIGNAGIYSRKPLPGRMYAGEIAGLMPKLRKLRNRADYHLGEGFSQADAEYMLNKSRKIHELCDDFKAVVSKKASSV